MSWLLLLKFIAIIFFLIMFLRKPSLVWGIGLLTVTTAVLLDTLLGTFDREAVVAELGFFYFIVAGALFAGAALWLWGLLLPKVQSSAVGSIPAKMPEEIVLQTAESAVKPGISGYADRGMLYAEIRERFGREDVLDLMYDLQIKENDVLTVDQDMNRLIVNIMDFAERNGQCDELALAVERILTPPPAENLPRLERISVESPPTILRQYLLANYSIVDLQELTEDLEIDWEQLDAGAKREKTRSLLQYVQRRNRLDELLALMYERAQLKPAEEA
ncbi:MAG: hypothetical protein ACK2UR_18400 [Candidatus Promineifilaceae bacterium]|jgi:hypothetical protein